MSKFRIIDSIAGMKSIDQMHDNDNTLRMTNTGLIVSAFSPTWGGGEFVWVRFTTDVRAKGLVSVDAAGENNIWIMTAQEITNAAAMGRPVGVSVLPATAGQFGWVQISGVTPVNAISAITPGGIGIGAVGQAGPITGGKQINNFRCVGLTSRTIVRTATEGRQGENSFKVNGTEGWFVGGFVSGTGIPAGAFITDIAIDEKTVTISANLTGSVSGDITMGLTNGTIFYPIAMLQRPGTQAQLV